MPDFFLLRFASSSADFYPVPRGDLFSDCGSVLVVLNQEGHLFVTRIGAALDPRRPLVAEIFFLRAPIDKTKRPAAHSSPG